jgi:purine-binding chemotaxis protein CheW
MERSEMSEVTTQLVVFSLGGEEYALPIARVHEIIRFVPPRSVASTDPSVRGVISLRGRIVPVYDLAVRLGVSRGATDTDSKIVMIETREQLVGVIVDDVEEVITIGSEAFDEAPGAGGRGIEAVARIDDRLVLLLDADGIVAADADEDAGGTVTNLNVAA